jgi:hypothetical protein
MILTRKKPMTNQVDAISLLRLAANVLDVRRNRFGKLECDSLCNEHLQDLAICYKIGGCIDMPEQLLVKVIRAFLKEGESTI